MRRAAVVALLVIVTACSGRREEPAPAVAPGSAQVARDAKVADAIVVDAGVVDAIIVDAPERRHKPETGPACCCLPKRPKDAAHPLQMMTAQRCEEAEGGRCVSEKECALQSIQQIEREREREQSGSQRGSSL